EFCDGGTCHRQQGLCQSTADCPPPAVCEPDVVAQNANDSDGDELPDPIDNCPTVWNIMQEDLDEDRVGDACDAVLTCARAATTTSVRCRVTVLGEVTAGKPEPGCPRAET